MNQIKYLFSHNSKFFIPCIIFWIAAAIPLAMYDKVEIHLWINQFYSQSQNIIWEWITKMGDSAFFMIVLFLGALFSYRFSFNLIVAGLIMLISVYAFKQFFDTPRPMILFKELGAFDMLKTIPDYPLYSRNSFPSGHTTTAFAVFGMLAFFLKNKWVKFSMFTLALAVAYSRMYLSQHFLEDVYAGSILGTAIASIVFLSLRNNSWLNRQKWADTGLIKSMNGGKDCRR